MPSTAASSAKFKICVQTTIVFVFERIWHGEDVPSRDVHASSAFALIAFFGNGSTRLTDTQHTDIQRVEFNF